MTRSELFQQLIAADLFPIPVDAGIEDRDVRGLRFVGDTAEFIGAAKALASKCVFVASRPLLAADFESVDEDGLGDESGPDDPGTVDLLTV